ncbi:MAG: acetylxylan esterase, partial [Saprospiraceae bacterium]
EEDPNDLLEFWEDLKGELAQVPLDPVVSFEQDDDYSTSYRVNLASIGNRRVYGYISVPDGDGPFPAVLELPPYGSAPGIANPDVSSAERVGMLAMSISIHNTEPDVEDPNSYEPDVIDDKDMNYYRYAVIGAIRALDYLTSRSDYDGENLAVMGVSQGGGLSLMVAGLDERIKLMANSNPALCHHSAYKYDRAGGFPYYLRKSENEFGTTAHFDATVEATKYFDAARLAKFVTVPSLTLIGYRDTICPPAASYAAFNNLPGPKILVQAREVGHNHPNEYQIGRYDLFRRYFPSTLTPPWPWPDNTTGYFVEAAANITEAEIGEEIQLSGAVELNGETNGDWTVRWRKVDGLGTANFSNQNTLSPTVSFDSPGLYRLEFSANDEAIDIPEKFYTVIDYVTIEVACSEVQTSISENICTGESIVIGNETYDTAGTYNQNYQTANGCDSIVIINLSVDPLPVVSLGEDAIITTDSILTFSLAANLFESIEWMDGSTSTDFIFSGMDFGAGTHEVSVTVENEFGCINTATVQIEVVDNTRVKSLDGRALVWTLIPNPAATEINVQIADPLATHYEIQLVNNLGQVLLKKNCQGANTTLGLENFPSGLYLVVLTDEEQNRVTKKLIISK